METVPFPAAVYDCSAAPAATGSVRTGFSGNGYAAQGRNFGIGLLGASPALPATHDNVVEDNVASGNTNGMVLGVGSHGNVIRRNLIVGNPPVQVSVENPSTTGVDIKNQSADGANRFQGNI